MACIRVTAFLSIILSSVWCLAADDDLRKFSALLSQADVLSKGFQGEFLLHSGEDQTKNPLDFDLDGLQIKARGRLWVKSGNALAEFLGGSEMTAVGIGSEFNDIVEVLASSDGTFFDFISIGSTVTPYANLRIYGPDNSQLVRPKLEVNVLQYLNAMTAGNGLSVESVLTDPNSVVRVDSARGYYSVHAEHKDAKNPATLDFEVTVTGREAKGKSLMIAGPRSTSITAETLVEAEVAEGRIVPRRVANRLSGPGYGVARRNVMQFAPKELGTLTFPITAEFFKRYERDYAVLRGDAKESSEFVSAVPGKFSAPLSDRMNPNPSIPEAPHRTGRNVLVVGNLIAVLAIVLWYLVRRRRKND